MAGIDQSPTQPSVYERLKNAGKWEAFKATKTPEELEYLRFSPAFTLRPDQRVRDGCRYQLQLSGRGSGKTHSGVFFIRTCVDLGRHNLMVVAPTRDDVLNTIFEDGFGRHLPKWLYQEDLCLNKQALTVRLLDGKTKIRGISGERPEKMRGPGPDAIWIDEGCAMPRLQDVLDQTALIVRGKRRKSDSKAVIFFTSTPKKSEALDDLVAKKSAHTRTVSMYSNRANLDPEFIREIEESVEGTLWADQEIRGRIVDLGSDFLWTQSDFVPFKHHMPARNDPLWEEWRHHFRTIWIGVDPAGSLGRETSKNLGTSDEGDEIGIVAWAQMRDNPKHWCVIDDWSERCAVDQWIDKSVQMAEHYDSRCIVFESVGVQKGLGRFYDTHPTVKKKGIKVVLANCGNGKKSERAAPISAMFKQGRVWMARKKDGTEEGFNHLAKLEKQMTYMSGKEFTGRGSPDRLDAMVHAATEAAALGKQRVSLGMFSSRGSVSSDIG